MRTVEQIACEGRMTAGQDLVAVGYLALKGTSELAVQGEEQLKKRFAVPFIRRCQKLYETRGLKTVPGLTELSEYGVSSSCAVGAGGVMTALWDYFETFSLGFEIELRSLPLLQETVEVCEVFDVNPYRLQSEGCLLMTAENGGALVHVLKQQNIPAVVVGRTTKQIGRRIRNGEIETFLDKPTSDELEHIQLTGGTL